MILASGARGPGFNSRSSPFAGQRIVSRRGQERITGKAHALAGSNSRCTAQARVQRTREHHWRCGGMQACCGCAVGELPGCCTLHHPGAQQPLFKSQTRLVPYKLVAWLSCDCMCSSSCIELALLAERFVGESTAAIAQLVARRSHNPRVVSSILTSGIF